MLDIKKMKNKLIIADGCCYDMDCYKTRLNNNVLVVGTSGSGKTRSIVTPNILQATGSYVISDPKGNLYDKYGSYLRKRGYRVVKLDLIHPENSARYNFMEYIRCEQDIVKIADALYTMENIDRDNGAFWDKAAKLLLQSVMAYLWEAGEPREQTMCSILRLLDACQIKEHSPEDKNSLDALFEFLPNDSYAKRQYGRFRVAAGKTLKSILITLYAELACYDSAEFRKMTACGEMDLRSIGDRKTAVFVIVSDTDRSMDDFANVFFSQALNELCTHADTECENNRLPVDVRFILDDFATNVVIKEFPRMIASIRSRGISATLMIQAESQLRAAYRNDDRTIIGNCDTYVYLGGNDIETAENVARRMDVPTTDILYMPLEECVVFRRGSRPHMGRIFNLEEYEAALSKGNGRKKAQNTGHSLEVVKDGGGIDEDERAI
ncbi:MAG: type IV secretory system conjugative DNA transfer family protein [Lachnospiraceae bacterium]|nr:type IV secretory system conjugative DNA transfer family protein [Lachnospiraceae bacterium]